MLIPDKVDEDAAESNHRFGVFATTMLTFFRAETGDTTQIATVLLAARYNNLAPIVAGTTLGMMLWEAADGTHLLRRPHSVRTPFSPPLPFCPAGPLHLPAASA
jgi:hypothetical protein